jgi:arachidonate 15-lipoxygenase (second type)/8-lipoxygenase (S-type)
MITKLTFFIVTPQIFSYRPAALASLINKGGFVDSYFAYTGAAAGVTATYLYNNKGAGSFSANYFIPNLEHRGLINSSFGPKLKSFPFYEDALPIHTSIRKFVSTFVDSYYKTRADFKQDIELQAWILEAIPAKIIDFPSSANRITLIDIITHIAFLGSAAHHTLNTNDVAEAMAVLPFHPVALYQPPPTSKGVTDLIPYLPGVAASVGQISVTALFSRPTFVRSDKSLSQMFNGQAFLQGTNPTVVEASACFTNEMLAQSEVVSSRKFDAKGLSHGMPFIWKALDPERAPYYFTI